MSKYSAEEVRARFEVWYNHLTQHPYAMAYNNPLGLPVEGDMKGGMWLGYKAAYAERIEADERAVQADVLVTRNPAPNAAAPSVPGIPTVTLHVGAVTIAEPVP